MRAIDRTSNTTATTRPPTPILNTSADSPYRSNTTAPSKSSIPASLAAAKTSTTPASRRRSFAASPTLATRPPLRPRDGNQNALSLTWTRPATATATKTASPAAAMPAGESRARQPPLSAAAAKLINRTPLTPKVVAKGPIVPSVSPLGRRAQNQSATLANAQVYRDEVSSTPPMAAPFLGNNNITPRSGTRQSRVDSTNTTPNGTPNLDKSGDIWDSGRAAWGVPTLSYEPAKLASPSESPPESADSKFFYASEAKPTPSPLQQRPVSVPQKQGNFFYANGTSAENKRMTSPQPSSSLTPVLGAMPEPAATGKFFYANGVPDAPSRQGLQMSASASTVSTSSRTPPVRPGTSSSATGHPANVAQRPTSPVKQASTPAGEVLWLKDSPSNPSNRPPVASPPVLAPPSTTSGKRRVSIDAAPRFMPGHTRAGSVPLAEYPFTSKPASPPQYSPDLPSPSASPGISQPTLTMASILQAVEDMDDDDGGDMDNQSGLQSPTKSVHSTDAVSELVANARRERKVQDLEITNASLEAINRTLERQLRKQTAELRRYRRLSRSGRLSLTSAASSRVASETLTERLGGLSDVSENESEEEDRDSLNGFENSSADSGSASGPSSPGAQLKRDERRLQLDLTKHQELLVDSQKMNQSIKRCLDWTEVLIKEGQKALAYHVRVSDVEIGGRVLDPLDEDDEDDKTEDGHPAHDRHDSVRDGSAVQPPQPFVKSPEDRDIGIELPVDGG